MKERLKEIPLLIWLGVAFYLAAVSTVSAYLASGELQYAVPLFVTGIVGAFFALYRHGKMTIVSALFGLILNLVLLFGLAAQDIFMAIQEGAIPNLHYGLPLVAGLFGYLLGQIHQLIREDLDSEEISPKVVSIRSTMPSDKDLAALEARIANTVSQAISEGIRNGLQQALHPVSKISERKSA